MSVLAGLAPVLPQVVTGVCAVIAGLGGVVLTQRYNDRQRARELGGQRQGPSPAAGRCRATT